MRRASVCAVVSLAVLGAAAAPFLGADDVPAQMCVRLKYTKASGMVVDAPPEAVLGAGC